jgi:hypothetical protein
MSISVKKPSRPATACAVAVSKATSDAPAMVSWVPNRMVPTTVEGCGPRLPVTVIVSPSFTFFEVAVLLSRATSPAFWGSRPLRSTSSDSFRSGSQVRATVGAPPWGPSALPLASTMLTVPCT